MPYANTEKQRQYQREWKAERKKEWFKGKKCARCGSTHNLELDHIDSSKKVSHNIWSWSEERRLAELEKCQVLCEECHMKKTLADRPKTEHGCAGMYQLHKCRCEECREWKRLSDAKYR